MTEASASEAVFEIRALSKINRMGEVDVQALSGVDLDVFAGEFLFLLRYGLAAAAVRAYDTEVYRIPHKKGHRT